MAKIIMNITHELTKAEDDLITELLAAVLHKDTDEINRLLKNQTIKNLFKRGVLKTSRTILSFEDEDFEFN